MQYFINKGNIFLIIAITILVQGCANIGIKEVSNFPDIKADGYKNSFDETFSNENRSAKRAQVGVALSGGGVRSASFSVGALEGLHESGVLDKVDVMSTVSGGGYAGYWFISALYELEKNNDNEFSRDYLFSDCFPDWPNYKRYIPKDSLGEYSESRRPLSREGCSNRRNNRFKHQFMISQQIDLLNGFNDETKLGQAIKYLDFTGKIGGHILTTPLHYIANTLFDWNYNGSALRLFYQNGIERTYGSVPNDIENGINIYENESELTFKELGDYLVDNWSKCSLEMRDKNQCRRMPLWIINTTAGVGNHTFNLMEEKPNLLDSVFWMTPFGYGSNQYGYVSDPIDDITIPKAVSISGAALDSQNKSGSGLKRVGKVAGLHAMNANLGYSINNYNSESSNRFWHKFLPWPFYYLHGFTHDRTATDIYLSDGGHSENLGAYSLIMRGIKNIIIIDAEQDPDGVFEALIKLRNSLYKEHGFNLVGKNGEKLEKFLSLASFNPYDSNKSVFNLVVKDLPDGYVSDDSKENYIDIMYVKSSIEIEKMDDKHCDFNEYYYPCTVAAFYRSNNLDGNGEVKNDNYLFPHHLTGANEYNSSASIYYAYRDLAKYLTKSIVYEKGRFRVNTPVK